MLTIGLIVFTVASVLCAQATNMTVLDFARGVQGIGGATMFACSLALIVQEFPAGERAMAFGLYGAVNGVSVALGPIVGGLLVEGFGWQSIFFLNVPIGIAAFVILRRKVVNLPGPATKIDWPGLVTFSGFMFLAVFATIRGNDEGWTSALILGCFTASVAPVRRLRRDRAAAQVPDVRPGAVSQPDLRRLLGVGVRRVLLVLALIFFLTTWLQSILGYSAVGTGLRMLVFTGGGADVRAARGAHERIGQPPDRAPARPRAGHASACSR